MAGPEVAGQGSCYRTKMDRKMKIILKAYRNGYKEKEFIKLFNLCGMSGTDISFKNLINIFFKLH